MNFRIPLINILLIAITISVNAREWQQDILGDGFELTYINHGNDYSGPIRSTVIKNKNPECDNGLKRGILYVHGYNDYFSKKKWPNSSWILAGLSMPQIYVNMDVPYYRETKNSRYGI